MQTRSELARTGSEMDSRGSFEAYNWSHMTNQAHFLIKSIGFIIIQLLLGSTVSYGQPPRGIAHGLIAIPAVAVTNA